jgi:hypothetical protein
VPANSFGEKSCSAWPSIFITRVPPMRR